MNVNDIKPFTVLLRDRKGFRGGAKGAPTCNSWELDGIARRAWKTIYDFNSTNAEKLTHRFIGKYAKHIVTGPKHELQALTFEQLKHVWRTIQVLLDWTISPHCISLFYLMRPSNG